MTCLIEENAVVLFQGDSITDACRKREVHDDLGLGYAMMAAAWFSALHPAKKVTFLNRGVSGDRVADLQRRWNADALALRPTWVSILVGINDAWRRSEANAPTDASDLEPGLREIYEQTLATGARLLLLEPFLVINPPDREKQRVWLDPIINLERRLAREYGALWVPFDGMFAAASTQREPAFWAGDGVHPSNAGHALMAQAWLRAVGAIG